MRPFIEQLMIDSDKKITPVRMRKTKKEMKKTFSDHFSVLLTISDLPKSKKEKEEKQVKWNLAKYKGWERYKEVSDEYADKIEQIVTDKRISIEDAMSMFNKIHNKIK